MNSFSGKKIALSTHYLIYSASQALRDYLRNEGSSLVYISHPLPGLNPDMKEHSYCEFSKGKRITHKKKALFRFNLLPLTMLYEFYLSLRWLIASKEKFDLYIGVDNFNALMGLILKVFGKVDKVVYYAIDYFPTRYTNKMLNNLYHYIDKICVKYSDETWNVSNKMILARKKHNKMDPKKYNRQYEVPIGIWYDSAPRKVFSKINKEKLIFVGHLVSHMGVDLVIESLPAVIKKIPNIKLEIIGGGEELENLRKLAEKLMVQKNIHFWDWVRDRNKLEEIMSDGAVGLATFNTKILDDKVKNADPGKIKDYMLLGMPVIVTGAISTAEVLSKNKCAIVISYDKKELSGAIIGLLSDDKRLKEYRNNALTYVRQFDYGNLFSENLERVFQK